MARNRGRPAYEPTASRREDVRLMRADGFSQERIAAQLGVTVPTLLKYFAADLEFGADNVRREALKSLKRASRKGNVSASKELLRVAGLMPPPAAPAPMTGEAAPVGKKEQAARDAQNAEQGTSWNSILKH